MKNKMCFLATFLSLQFQFSSAQSWQETSSGFADEARGIVWITAADDIGAYAIPMKFADQGFVTNNEVTITLDGGTTWYSQVVPGLEDYYLTGAEAVTSKIVYLIAQNNVGIVSNGIHHGGGSKVLSSIDGGSTWLPQAPGAYSGAASDAKLIFFFDRDNGVIFGDPESGAFEIYTTRNKGKSWIRVAAVSSPDFPDPSVVTAPDSPDPLPNARLGKTKLNVPTPLPNEYGLRFLGDQSGETVWAGTVILDENNNVTGGRLLQSDNMGSTWYVRNTAMPVTGRDVIIRFRSHEVGLLESSGNLFRTVDGGTTWTPLNYSGIYFSHGLDNLPGLPGTWISAGAGTRLSAESNYTRGSFITYDDGNHWITIDKEVDHTFIFMTSSAHGYSGGVTGPQGRGGMFLYSSEAVSTESGDFTMVKDVSVYPNPIQNELILTYTLTQEQELNIGLYDMSGRLINQMVVNENRGRGLHYESLNVGEGLVPGNYVLRVSNGEANKCIKVVKQ